MPVSASCTLPVLLLMQLVAVLLFVKGFLLTRVELPNTNACGICTHPTNTACNCMIPQRYDKVGGASSTPHSVNQM
jgi:hypothetical protein